MGQNITCIKTNYISKLNVSTNVYTQTSLSFNPWFPRSICGTWALMKISRQEGRIQSELLFWTLTFRALLKTCSGFLLIQKSQNLRAGRELRGHPGHPTPDQESYQQHIWPGTHPALLESLKWESLFPLTNNPLVFQTALVVHKVFLVLRPNLPQSHFCPLLLALPSLVKQNNQIPPPHNSPGKTWTQITFLPRIFSRLNLPNSFIWPSNDMNSGPFWMLFLTSGSQTWLPYSTHGLTRADVSSKWRA